MADGRKILSALSGLPEREVDVIWEQVKANHKLLGQCVTPHLLAPCAWYTDKKLLAKTYRCSKCGGEMAGDHARAYMEGLAHGRKERRNVKHDSV